MAASIAPGMTQAEVLATPAAATIPDLLPVAPILPALALLARRILTAGVQMAPIPAVVPAAVRIIPAEGRAPRVPVRPDHLLPGVRAVRLAAAVAPTESTNSFR